MANGPKYPVNTVIKAIELVEYLAGINGGMGATATEIWRELDLTKSTTHRLLDTLSFYDWITKDNETGRYRLGWEMYKIGQMLPTQNNLLSIDKKFLADLSNTVAATVNLGVLKHDETVIISQVESTHMKAIAHITAERYEAIYATALGKMMISEMTDDEIREMFSGTEFIKYTENTVRNVDELIERVNFARKNGYALDEKEFNENLYCIAMPIRNYTGRIVAALSVSSIPSEVTDEKHELILRELKKTTDAISETLGNK